MSIFDIEDHVPERAFVLPLRKIGRAFAAGRFAAMRALLAAAALAAGTAQAQVVVESVSTAVGANAGIAYVGSGSAATADTTTCASASVSPSIPSGSSGDLLIALVNVREDGATLSANGWSSLMSPTTYAGQEFKVAIYYRFATGIDDLTIDQSGTCNSIIARIARFSGVDATTPFDGAAPYYGASQQHAGDVSSGTIATTSSDAMLIGATFVADRRSVDEGSWSEAFDSTANLSRDVEISLNYQTAGSIGNQSFSNWDIGSSGDRYSFGVVFALKPASRRIDIAMPSGVAENDLLLAALSVRHNAATITPPSGWTLIQDTPQASGAASCDSGTTAGIRTLTYYKIATANETTASFGYASTCADDGFAAGGILRVSGADTSSPIVASAEATTSSATTHVAPSLTPGVADAMLVTVHSYGSSRSWNQGYSGVSGMTERIDQRSYNADNARGTTLGVYTQTLTGSGATGTRTAQGAGDADNGATQSIALRRKLPHHIRIEHDGAGDLCGAESVTVKACADAACSSLHAGSVSVTLSASSGTWATNPVTVSGGSASASLTAAGTGTVTVGVASSSPATSAAADCQNTATGSSSCAITFTACVAACNAGTVSACSAGVVNTYYPGSGTAAAGSKTITVGSPSGCTGLRADDLVLIMQMQDATVNWGANATDANYGTVGAIGAGTYEYAKVASFVGSTITLTANLANSYTTAAASGSSGQKTFQVIRVPVYSSATLPGGLTALAWNGSVGGVFALDVVGTLALGSGTSLDVSGKGFRGGGGCEWVGDNSTSGLSASDYRRNSSSTCPSGSRGAGRANGIKGEGIAGTPRYVYDGSAHVNTGVEGYPNGSTARGAPANAGGGGTDDDPANNDENTGGGGGAGHGGGGTGGWAWSNGSSPGRGLGGTGVSQSATRLTLGGGAGAGTSNNGTDDGNGLNSSGVAGGGIVMLRAGGLTGTATITADGSSNTLSVGNDGSGGGGGGGAILVSAGSGVNGVTAHARGGTGGSNSGGGSSHGPGGGGGGGFVLTTSATSACAVTGGSNGTTVGADAFGASAGSAGSCATSTGLAGSIPGLTLGSGPTCAAALAHYAISYPNGNPGVTCEALAVRVTGHGSDHSAAAPPAGTEITLTPAAGGWAAKSGNSGTFTAPNRYTFTGDETYAEFWLTQTTATDSPHIDIDVADGAGKTDNDGDASEDAKAQFADAVFRFYSDTDGTAATIASQVAGVQSVTYYLKAIRTDSSTGTCTAALQNQTTTVGIGYQCLNPTTCVAGDVLNVTANETKTVARNNSGGTANTTAVSMVFNAAGYAPLSFNYRDVGQIALVASKTLAADNTKTPPLTAATVTGTSGGFVVKPYGFKLSGLTCDTDDKISTSAGAFCVAGGTFTGTVTPFYYVDSPSTNNYGGVTPSFGQEASAQTVTFIPDSLVNPTSAAGGTLPGFTSSTTGSFSTASYTATATMEWPEVGTITVKPDTLDYLGAGDIPTAGRTASIALAGNIGRFYPKDFALDAGSTVTAGCATGGFTYMGQPNLGIAYTLTARNKGESKTGNYLFAASGGYANLGTVSLVAENANAGTDLGTRITDLGSPKWIAGEYAVAATAATFTRDAAPDGAFDALAIGARVADTDATLTGPDMRATTAGDCVAATNCDAVQVGAATRVRFGMLRIDNASGSERQNLPVGISALYYAGNPAGWAVNSLDGCTALPAAPFTGHATNSATDACFGTACTSNTGGTTGSVWLHHVGGAQIAQAAAPTSGSATLASGSGTLTLTRPVIAGAPAPGTLEMTLVAPAWLKAGSGRNGTAGSFDWNPMGRVTFGVYGPTTNKSRFIYIRENY